MWSGFLFLRGGVSRVGKKVYGVMAGGGGIYQVEWKARRKYPRRRNRSSAALRTWLRSWEALFALRSPSLWEERRLGGGGRVLSSIDTRCWRKRSV